MKRPVDSHIIFYGSRLLSPYIMLFGLYVIFHGHYSPGGGFQGGTLLAASVLLVRISGGQKIARLQFGEMFTKPLAVIGIFIYFATGLLCIFGSGLFLDYGHLPIAGMHGAELRYWGLLSIEFGVGLAVMGILIALYDNLVQDEDYG